jgi:citrate lyase beta subunit
VPRKTIPARWPETIPPLRSLLFVPGGRPDRFPKALAAGADAVIFDLEDSVPESGKEEARQNIARGIADSGDAPAMRVVRINPVATRHWQKDFRAVVRKNLDAILLPKPTHAREVAAAARLISRLERERKIRRGTIRLFLLVETAGAVLRVESMVETSERVALLVFGGEDYSLSTGADASPDGRELLYARSKVVAAAAAYGCPAVDGVYMRYGDLEGLRSEAESSKRMGFSGKLIVHPAQIEPVHRVFSVSGQELEWAKRVLGVAERMAETGAGAAGLDGQLVDAPVIARAQRIVAAAEREGQHGKSQAATEKSA